MGRMLGAFDGGGELDRPDLNKCPDCGCFFGGENCPLCGKVCPEEMRAGNRKPPKKEIRPRGRERVLFVDWYHRWWFIIFMMIVMPLAGIILLFTSPHKKGQKIFVAALAVLYTLLTSVGIWNIFYRIGNAWEKPVDTSLSREEYTDRCEAVDAHTFYRSAEEYEDEYVAVTLTVESSFTDIEGTYSNKKHTTYYICHGGEDAEVRILIRDCLVNLHQNLLPGDTVTVYGEGAGNVSVTDIFYETHTAPCLHMAYVDVIGTAGEP